jgi:hypothetical protein
MQTTNERHNNNWQLAFQTMFQMPFLFILNHKIRNYCCKSSFQMQKIVSTYLTTFFGQQI